METVKEVRYYIPKKGFNCLTGWYEKKDPKGKDDAIRVAKIVRINGKQTIQL